jgi:hypothetical protein
MAAEHTLGLLMLRCETTGKPIHSGVPFTQNDLDRIRLARIHLQCPACGELHGFSFAEAYIAKIEKRPGSGPSEPTPAKGERRRR